MIAHSIFEPANSPDILYEGHFHSPSLLQPVSALAATAAAAGARAPAGGQLQEGLLYTAQQCALSISTQGPAHHSSFPTALLHPLITKGTGKKIIFTKGPCKPKGKAQIITK
jgi:hypothetical protein